MAMSSSSSSPNSQKSTPIFPSFTSTLLSRLPFNSKPVQSPPPVTVPFFLPASNFNTASPRQARSVVPGMRIEGLSSKGGGGGGGPVFVGQVFTMLDPSGNGLVAVTRHFHLPFLSERSAASFNKAATSTSGISNYSQNDVQTNTKEDDSRLVKNNDFQFPFGNWIPNIWPGQHGSTRLPNVTMLGIAVGRKFSNEQGQFEKDMDDLSKELEQSNYKHNDQLNEEKDPLFVANFGDYSRFTRFNSS